jgi:hypothetical protein
MGDQILIQNRFDGKFPLILGLPRPAIALITRDRLFRLPHFIVCSLTTHYEIFPETSFPQGPQVQPPLIGGSFESAKKLVWVVSRLRYSVE